MDILVKAIFSFVIRVTSSVCLSVSVHRITLLPLDGISCNLLLKFTAQSVDTIQGLLQTDKNNTPVVYTNTDAHL